MSAEGVPVHAEDVPPVRLTFMFEGNWVIGGGFLGRRGVYAVLQSSSGLTLMVDRRAVEMAAMALGLKVVDPEFGPRR